MSESFRYPDKISKDDVWISINDVQGVLEISVPTASYKDRVITLRLNQLRSLAESLTYHTNPHD